jgi:hypothetical protein
MHPSASSLVTFGIAAIGLAIALLAPWLYGTAASRLGRARGEATRRAALVVVAWVALTGLVAASGVLRRLDIVPPPFAAMFVVVLVAGVALARSRAGEILAQGVPLWGLVLLQSYRFPLEVVMHLAGAEGTMPVALSFDGLNFDVVTGSTALALGLTMRARAVPLWLVHAWNLLGMAALVNIAAIALLSSPLVAYWGPDQVNLWVTYPPFVWLPTVLVVVAVAGHGVVLRRLLAEGRAARAPRERAVIAAGSRARRPA